MVLSKEGYYRALKDAAAKLAKGISPWRQQEITEALSGLAPELPSGHTLTRLAVITSAMALLSPGLVLDEELRKGVEAAYVDLDVSWFAQQRG